MKSMTVQPGRVTQLSQSLNTGANQIQAILDQLDRDVKALEAAWDGDARQAYHTAQTQWNASILEIRELLTKIAATTSTISQDYTTTDGRTANLFT